MSNEVITIKGKDIVVRDDTARAYRWIRFEVIILTGITLLLILGILFFAGVFTAVDPNLNEANTVPNASQPGP